jgi:hypothetical protein
MTEEVKQDLSNINISIEQIIAAILNKSGKIELTLQELLTDYSSKSIAVNQDPDTQMVTFELSNVPKTQTKNKEV